MAEKPKSTAPAPAKAAEATTGSGVKLTLQEFCMRLSKTCKRTELIGAFEYAERRAGHLKDAEDAFNNRFKAFSGLATN